MPVDHLNPDEGGESSQSSCRGPVTTRRTEQHRAISGQACTMWITT